MELEIRDVQTSETIKIPAPGLTFGRAGSKADLAVPDRTVSSQHARIYAQGSDWYLEDLRSSNGTFVEGERISTPTRLAAGTRFAFCRYAYEVVGPVGDGAGTATAVLGDAALTSGLDATDVRKPGGGPITDDRRHPSLEHSSSQPRREAPSGQMNEPTDSAGGGTGMEGGFGAAMAYFMANAPKAIAYYMGAVPVMLFNPFGTIRKGIEEPKFGALETRELITFALPACGLFVILSSIGAIIVSIAHGVFAAGMIVSPVISVAIGIVVSVMLGFIWHPLFRWWVRILEGESDEVSRSNYFIMVFTAMPILAMSTLLGVIIDLIPLPFIGIVPILISVIAQLLMTFIHFKWFMHFRVVKWFPIVLLILGGLSCITAVGAAIDLIKVEIDRFSTRSSSSSVSVDVGDPEEAMAGARNLDKRLASGEISAAEAAELARRAATAAAVAANAGAVAAAGAANEAATASASPRADSTVTPPDAARGEASAETSGRAPSAGTTGRASAGTTTPAGRPSSAPGPAGETPYEVFLRRRAAVEATIERDPTILNRNDVRPLYKQMHKITFKLQKKHHVKLGKNASPEKMAEKKVEEKLRDAAVFEQTATIVDRLYRKVVESR